MLTNDSDPDSSSITAVLVSGPSHAGSFTLNGDGSFSYTPAANFNGSDSFIYKANDGAADSSTATVSITVNPVNDPPVAVDDSYTTNEDTQLSGSSVLANDSDVDGDSLTAVLVSGPAHGTLTLNANGTFTYTPTADFDGSDTFTYKANDGQSDSNGATVSLTVNAVNDAPSFTKGPNQTSLANQNTDGSAKAYTINPWATAISPGPANESGQTVDFVIDSVTPSNLFTVQPAVSATGVLTFTTDPAHSGTATVTLHAHDNGGTANGGIDASATQSFTIQIVNPGAPPDVEPPSKPGSLVATAAASDRVELSWVAASDDRGVVGYEVERCTGAGCTDFAHLADTSGTGYSDTSVAASTSYTYRVRAADAAGNLGPFSDPATATTPAGPPVGPGPLRVGPTGRYLVDRNGVPFLISGESPQAMIGDLTESDAALFFANRRAHGFNTVWINLLCNGYTGCNGDGSTWDGVPPFTTPGDFSTPNEAYFAHVDRILRLAEDYGFIVILDPAETGGWLGTMVSNGVDKLRAYGQYLGRRYKDFPNIIWMHGNDYQEWGPTNDPYVTAIDLGIRDVDPSRLQTVELNYTVSGSLDDPVWAPLIDLNASYTYLPDVRAGAEGLQPAQFPAHVHGRGEPTRASRTPGRPARPSS